MGRRLDNPVPKDIGGKALNTMSRTNTNSFREKQKRFENVFRMSFKIEKESPFSKDPSVFASIAINLIFGARFNFDVAKANLAKESTFIVIAKLLFFVLVKIEFHSPSVLDFLLNGVYHLFFIWKYFSYVFRPVPKKGSFNFATIKSINSGSTSSHSAKPFFST